MTTPSTRAWLPRALRAALRLVVVGALVCGLQSDAPRAASTGFSMVVNRATLDGQMDKKQLRGLLLGASNWPDGSPVVLVLLPKGHPAMTWMAEEVLGMPEAAFRKQLLQRVFRGSSTRPTEVGSVAESVGVLQSTQGALGPLPSEGLPPALAPIGQ